MPLISNLTLASLGLPPSLPEILKDIELPLFASLFPPSFALSFSTSLVPRTLVPIYQNAQGTNDRTKKTN
ncbi:hypothetical protein VF21_09964 [Pseudogymnoascus sp. 05NY08]|nr:hypothetical protein VF21_09964 [Pseudogymnoascus sp. 05NY08]